MHGKPLTLPWKVRRQRRLLSERTRDGKAATQFKLQVPQVILRLRILRRPMSAAIQSTKMRTYVGYAVTRVSWVTRSNTPVLAVAPSSTSTRNAFFSGSTAGKFPVARYFFVLVYFILLSSAPIVSVCLNVGIAFPERLFQLWMLNFGRAVRVFIRYCYSSVMY